MKTVIRVYSYVLLIYTGWRVFDLMTKQLPPGPSGFWLAVIFLFATEIGMLVWIEASERTTTYNQHLIANTMIWVDFAASLGAGVADMILNQTLVTDYQIPDALGVALIFGLPLVFAANVAAAILYQANDARVVLDRSKRFVMFEAQKQALKRIAEGKTELAQAVADELLHELTPTTSKTRITELSKTYNAETSSTPALTELKPVEPVEFSTNGHGDANPTKRRRSAQ